MTDQELKRAREVAIEAARRGGAELERWRGKFTTQEKSRADLVTDADFASQKAIEAVLLTEFPQHRFLGEEGGDPSQRDETPTWIVDPLDGTTNYVHDYPAYCVSIGLVVGTTAQVGVIFDPRLNELYSSARGHGATLNEKPIRVSSAKSLADALLVTGFPYDYEAQKKNLEVWARLSRTAQSLRRTGSTALNMAHVAVGRFDGYWCFDNKPWDVAAGAVLILEAGGKLTASDGTPFDPYRPDLCATGGSIHELLLQGIRAETEPPHTCHRPDFV